MDDMLSASLMLRLRYKLVGENGMDVNLKQVSGLSPRQGTEMAISGVYIRKTRFSTVSTSVYISRGVALDLAKTCGRRVVDMGCLLHVYHTST
jgi:hypothetical protein